jgi:hypothetical protein
MPPALSTIHAFLDGLVRRERLLLAGQTVAQVFVVGCVALLGASVALSVGRRPSEAVLLLGVSGLVGLVLALAFPLAMRWRASGRAMVQARRVEAHAPDLKHRLVTVLGRAELLVSPAGPVLLQRAATHVQARVADITPDAIHPASSALRAWVVAVALVMLTGLAQLTLPVGPLQALAAVGGPPMAADGAAVPPPTEAAERAVVGDIVLRYVFPEYTGIDPVEVANSDGTIHAPAGTTVQVRARTATSFDSAALQVNDGTLLATELLAGRDLYAELVIGEPGVWRFWLMSGTERTPSKDFKLVVEEDAAPVVTLESGAAPAVPHDRPVPLGWNVRDDFGIERVVVEVRQGDETREIELRAPPNTPRELRGALRLTPRDLGLQPGESATLKVVAYDNDLAGGNKRGESAEIEITSMGPRGRGRRLSEQAAALRDAMLPVLAAFLVEQLPPGETIASMQGWAGEARNLYEPTRDLVEAGGGLREGNLRDSLIKDVLESGARLIRFSVTTWDPSSTRRITDGDIQRFADLHGEAVVSLEKAIYILDSLLVSAAMADVARMAEELTAEAQELASRAQDMQAAEILARLDKLTRTMAELAQKAQEVNEGALQEYLNGRLDDTRNLMDQIRQAVAEGRMEDARELLEQLAEQVQQMSEGINDRMAAGESGEDQLGQAVEQAMEALEQLEADQRTLADDLEGKRQELGQEFSEQLELWNKLDALAREGAERGRGAVESTGDGRGWRTESVRRLEVLNERTGGIEDAARARDLDRTGERVREALRPADIALRTVEMERTRSRISDNLPEDLDGVAEQAGRVRAILDEMLSVLDKLEERQQRDDPRMQQAAQEMAAQQQALQERQQQLQKEVQKVERALPTGDGQATEAMQRAGEAMERAEGSLEGGQAMAGEGHQREAAERVGEARERLGQQMQQMQQMQQARGQMQGQQRDEGDGGEEEGPMDQDPGSIDIPAPEDFQTPEAYRRALLEGMAGDVPEEYRSMKQQYFEELVRQ